MWSDIQSSPQHLPFFNLFRTSGTDTDKVEYRFEYGAVVRKGADPKSSSIFCYGFVMVPSWEMDLNLIVLLQPFYLAPHVTNEESSGIIVY